jgi:hypothetical protein
MTAQDVLDTVSPGEVPSRRRVRPMLVALIVVVVVAGFVGLRVSQRPTGWVAQQSRYSSIQKVSVPGVDVCVQAKLTGVLKYERSTAAEAGDRHFRNLRITGPAIETRFYASCARGAAPVKLSHVHDAQAWAALDGRVLERRATTYTGRLPGVSQYNSGWPIHARGVTARGKICMTAAPSVTARNGQQDFTAPLHPVTVCGH